MFNVTCRTFTPSCSLGLCLAAVSFAGVPPAVIRADTVFDSGTTTIGTGTNFGTNLYVGHSGTATMRVVAEANASDDHAFIGYAPGSIGTAIVTGGTWTTGGEIHVGTSGKGTLNVEGGYVYAAGSAYVGDASPGTGVASVTSGTLWVNRLYLGSSGTGELHVDGGRVHSNLYLAVGQLGTGHLGISGGAVTSSDGAIGSHGGTGSALVSGGAWTLWNGLYIGAEALGSGTLNITGGTVSDFSGNLGYQQRSTGVANVTGGIWSSSGVLVVGSSGTGMLNVDGGTVVSGTSYVGGWVEDSRGTVTVSSGTWVTNNELTVGMTDQPGNRGVLTMSGGLVIVGGTLARGVDGTIHLNPGGTLQIGSGSASGVLGVSSITNNGTLIFDRATDYVFSGAVSGSGAIVKRGAGMLALSGSSGIGGPTVIRQGVVQLGHATALSSSTISLLAGGTLSLTAALRTTVGGLDPGAGGLVDVGNGGATVASGLSSADLVAAILSGRADGSWSGTSGITSSVAAADVARGVVRGVGWLDDGDGSVVVAYAASGDTNVDWIIDVLDAANVIASGKYSTELPASWLDGDFNYDGVVDILDASEFTATGLYNMGPYNVVDSLLPEPVGGAAAAACLAALWAAAKVLPRLRRRAAASQRRPAIVTAHEAGSGTAATLAAG